MCHYEYHGHISLSGDKHMEVTILITSLPKTKLKPTALTGFALQQGNRYFNSHLQTDTRENIKTMYH